MTKTDKEINHFFSELKKKHNLSFEINGLIDVSKIDPRDPFYSIYNLLDEKQTFNPKISEPRIAIKYLEKHDPMLNESLELVKMRDYSLEQIDSSLLASFLARKNYLAEFADLEEEIINFFNN